MEISKCSSVLEYLENSLIYLKPRERASCVDVDLSVASGQGAFDEEKL